MRPEETGQAILACLNIGDDTFGTVPIDDDQGTGAFQSVLNHAMKSGLKQHRTGRPAHWQHFDHDADIGVCGIGPSLEDAFDQSALALTAVVTDEKVEAQTAVEIDCESPDLDTLYLDWLNSLVYEMAARGLLFSRFDISIGQNGGYRLQATAWGESVDQARHNPVVEVKGATYTELSVKPLNGSWRAQCVLDV